MAELTWWGLPAVALVVVTVEMAKQAGFPSRYAGLLAAGIGLVGGALSYYLGDSPVAEAMVGGLVAGLTASGLWSAAKSAVKRR